MAVIAPQSEFQYKYLNCDSNIIVAGGAMGCVPAETEFLTPRGWKKISEYKSGDLVGTVSFSDNNKNSLLLFFAEPYEFIKLPCDKLTYVEKDGVRKTLSEEHRVVHWKDGKFVVDVWEELISNNKEIEVRNSIDSTTMNLGDVKYFIKQFIGNKKNNSFNEFVTDCKDTADGIQLAFITSGIGAQIKESGGSYTVNVVENTTKLFGKGSEIGEVKTSDGFKYCFTVDTGFFLIRENGNVFVTGNSSKSYIGLMRHLRWAEDPYYRGYCIRKNSTTLMKPSGLFEEALDLYRQYDERVIPKLKDQKIVFPSGATVAFSHYENDKASELYRGLQLSSAFYDEATDSQERHIWFLISRLRTKANMTPSIWLTCNPDPDHYLREWVDWWLYPEGHPKFGLPDPEKNGKERYILRLGDDLHWGDSKGELIEKFGNPRLPVDHPRQPKPLSITVLLGTVYDNPILVHTNPHYVSALEALPEIEKRRNLYGDWEAREEGSSYFDRKWVEEVSDIDEDEVEYTVRSFDLAGTLKSDKNPSPDYTASVRMRRMKDGTYIIDDVVRTRIRAGDWKDFILGLAQRDPANTTYLYPVDPNPAARRMADLMVKDLITEGRIYVKKIDTNKSKLDRFRPFSSMAQNGGVKFLKDCGNDLENGVNNCLKFVYRELEVFNGERNRSEVGHDDRQTCRQ